MKIFAEEVRQFLYCARIPFLRRNFGTRRSTYSMKKGRKYHSEKARRAYKIKEYLSHYNLYVEAKSQHLAAVPDIILQQKDHIAIVENKRFLLGKPSFSIIAQAVIGGVCAEEHFLLPLKEVRIVGFNGITHKILVSESLKQKTLEISNQVRESLKAMVPPKPTKDKTKCESCEYLNVCGTI